MIYLQLFLSFLQIGMFSFGGGYAAMPLIQGQVVTTHGWLTMSEFTDLITISQITPGPIAVNSATFVGLKIAGIPGAVVATVGCILPSCIIVTILARLYLKYRNLDLLQGVLKSLRPGGNDRIGRDPDPEKCVLGKRRDDFPDGYGVEHGGDLRNLCVAASENETESHLGHGTGGCHEGGNLRNDKCFVM